MADMVKIRLANTADCEKLLDIYAPYVTGTAITFEYDVPSAEEFADRIKHVQQKYPYLAAEHNGEIIGYAYAGAFKTRAAYSRSCELSIYINKSLRKAGTGRALYTALEKLLLKQGVLNTYACIAYIDNEDEFLTHDSIKFHKAMGYVPIAHFHKCGYKFNRWYDMVWYEKQIGIHSDLPKPFVPIGDISEKDITECGISLH